MTVQDYLKYATNSLQSVSVATARLDTIVLMEHVLGVDRAKLLAEPKMAISRQKENVLNELLARRVKHEPIAYITQQSEFYGRPFFVSNAVLEPRPESETMIELLKSLVNGNIPKLNGKHIKLADIGTGSGALGITAALECPGVSVDLIDIDKKALKVAKNNVVLHTIKANAFIGDLLTNNQTDYHILLCNLPYVPDDFSINLAASHEPVIAIFGGKDGLDIYRRLFELLRNRQHKPLYILTESLPPSQNKLQEIARKSGYALLKSEDFVQVFALKK